MVRRVASAGRLAAGLPFIALRYQKKPKVSTTGEPQQYQLFDTPEYGDRVFVTNMTEAIYSLVWFFYNLDYAQDLSRCEDLIGQTVWGP
jgi:hypothetical protein